MPPVRTPARTSSSAAPYDRPTSMKGHLPEDLVAKKPGHCHTNNCMIGSKVDQHLRQALRGIEPEVIDYDLAVAYFLLETSHLHLPDIPQSVDLILQDYQILRPLTSRQNDLLTCAQHIRSIIDLHLSKPSPIKPFALRYPNIRALNDLTTKRSKSPRPLASDRSHVLVDLAGRLLAINLLPSEELNPEVSRINQEDCSEINDLLPELRVLNALEGAVKVHGLPCFRGPIGDHLVHPSSSATLTSHVASGNAGQTRLSKVRNELVMVPGAVHGSLAYEAFGYGLGSPNVKADTKMKLGFDRQGWTLDDCGKRPTSVCYLPLVMGMGEENVYKRVENARLLQEFHWPYEVSRALNAAVQPETYKVAEKVVSFIQSKSSALLASRIESLSNKVIQGQEINYNTQVAPHRDGKNSNLLDSVFIYGRNFSGGRFIFTSLGVSVCADPGYSVHGRFKLLEHAVSTILPGPDIHSPPLRVSLALYSHADVYAGPARVSAARSGTSQFSDQSMWLPFAPTNFSTDTCRKILRKEENKWRKKFKKISICHQKMMEDQ